MGPCQVCGSWSCKGCRLGRALILALLATLILVAPATAGGPLDSVWQAEHTATLPDGSTLATVSLIVLVQDGHIDDDVGVAILFGDGLWVAGWAQARIVAPTPRNGGRPLTRRAGAHIGYIRIAGELLDPQGQAFATFEFRINGWDFTGTMLEGDIPVTVTATRLY